MSTDGQCCVHKLMENREGSQEACQRMDTALITQGKGGVSTDGRCLVVKLKENREGETKKEEDQDLPRSIKRCLKGGKNHAPFPTQTVFKVFSYSSRRKTVNVAHFLISQSRHLIFYVYDPPSRPDDVYSV